MTVDEKRKHHRIPTKNLTVDASDGIGFCTGSARDISKFGMCLVDMRKHFGDDVENLTVVITAKDKVFKMKVRPRWHADDGMTDKIGAEIEKAPWEWTEFVMNLDEKDEDVWGNW